MSCIRTKIAGGVLITSLVVTGCGLLPSANQPAEEDPGIFYTQAAETMSVAMTMNAIAELQSQPTSTNTPLPTDTPTPTLEPMVMVPTDTPMVEVEIPTQGPTETPMPTNPMLHVTTNTNCRAGPSPAYGVEGYITTDMFVEVVGINEGRSWWWVKNPTYPGYHCWVQKMTSVIEGDTSEVPIYRDPWTMTPADPEISVQANVYPKEYSGACPQQVTLVATIFTNRAGQFHYLWLKRGSTKHKTGWVNIAADSSAVVYDTVNVEYDTESYFLFKVDYPVKYVTTKLMYNIDCKGKLPDND